MSTASWPSRTASSTCCPVAWCRSSRYGRVLIAGGGPASLAAAAELAWHGIGCVVIEPRTEVSRRRPKAKTTSVRTMEHLRRWGLAGRLRAAAPLPVAWSQRVTFCDSLSGRRITDIDGAFGLVTGRDDRFAEAGQQFPQPVVEEVLRAHLQACPLADLRLGQSATALAQDADGVTVTVRAPGGDAYLLRACYVIGCDGVSGVVREQVGARYAGRSDQWPNFNLVFRAPGLDTPLGPAVQYWVVGGATTGVLGRLDLAGTWWAGLPGIEAGYGTAHAAELIAGLIGGPAEHEVLATDPWAARMLIVDTFAAGRVFLAGESAHVNRRGAATASTPASATPSTSPGRSPRSSGAGRRPPCWTATTPNAAASSSRPSPAQRRTWSPGRRTARRRRRYPVCQVPGIPQPRPGARLHLRRLSRHPASRPRAPAR
jgi:2-polyprenyl-6-methoxyphenol hydroxylase-like FAD-dependent oxidoreductase